MKIDAGLMGPLKDIPKAAALLESQGFNGAITAEMAHDPFFPLLVAAEHTERIELMTSIAVAFSRSPMIMANGRNQWPRPAKPMAKGQGHGHGQWPSP